MKKKIQRIKINNKAFTSHSRVFDNLYNFDDFDKNDKNDRRNQRNRNNRNDERRDKNERNSLFKFNKIRLSILFHYNAIVSLNINRRYFDF